MSRNSVLEEFNVNRLAVIQRICVAEHFEDEQQMSQSQVGEKTGKVVCHQHNSNVICEQIMYNKLQIFP